MVAFDRVAVVRVQMAMTFLGFCCLGHGNVMQFGP